MHGENVYGWKHQNYSTNSPIISTSSEQENYHTTSPIYDIYHMGDYIRISLQYVCYLQPENAPNVKTVKA